MVSAGDTDISLYICPGSISNFSRGRGYSGQVKTQNTLKCQDLPNFQFLVGGGGGRWGYSGQVKTQNTLSAKICLIFNFGGEGDGVFWASQNSKILLVPRSA